MLHDGISTHTGYMLQSSDDRVYNYVRRVAMVTFLVTMGESSMTRAEPVMMLR